MLPYDKPSFTKEEKKNAKTERREKPFQKKNQEKKWSRFDRIRLACEKDNYFLKHFLLKIYCNVELTVPVPFISFTSELLFIDFVLALLISTILEADEKKGKRR
jgi:hypothetical protein